jgi:acetyl-CoA carboxylase carboxyl transferase subunit beta
MAKLKTPSWEALKSRFNDIKNTVPQKEQPEKEAEKDVKKKEEIPAGYVKCGGCGNLIEKKALGQLKICPKCAKLFRLNSKERVRIIADEGSFKEFDVNMEAKNPLNFPDYEVKIRGLQEKTGLKDAVRTGVCTIGGYKTVLAVMDSGFMMGSMGSVVGEKITRAFEYATAHQLPIIICTVSGGARMQEGIMSLMQMAKTSGAAKRHSDAGLLYITVLTDPTTGGVTASFAMEGDIILAEPDTLVAFAGPRVIEQTIRQKLPKDFQSSEFVLQKGFVDAVVNRNHLKNTLIKLLKIHGYDKEA